MQSTDITAKVKNFISFGLAGVIALAAVIGYAEYKYWHKDETLQLSDAKVVGTMVSVRILANGKVKELSFEDGAEVKAGDVIARLEVAITAEEIQQLENTVQLAKDNYAQLAQGQWVKVPVQRERVTYPPAPPPTVIQSSPSGNLAKLEERANRMAELLRKRAGKFIVVELRVLSRARPDCRVLHRIRRRIQRDAGRSLGGSRASDSSGGAVFERGKARGARD